MKHKKLSHLTLQAMTYHERMAILEDEIDHLRKTGGKRVQVERCEWLQREITGPQVEQDWQSAQEPAGLPTLRRVVA